MMHNLSFLTLPENGGPHELAKGQGRGCAVRGVAWCGVAQAAPLVLVDPYVEAGVSDLYGTLGSNGSTSPGILFDPTGTSTYGVNDFLTPGSPFEGFYLTADGANWGSNNRGTLDNINSPFTLTALSPTQVRADSTTADGVLSIRHQYTLGRVGTRSEIVIQTTLTNRSGTAVTNLKALRTLDPDPDVNTYGDYDTVNTLPSATRACAEGASTGQTICLTTASASYSPRAGIGPDAPWPTSPDDFLNGVNAGNGDNTIGLAFNIGTLAPGASVVLNYTYILSETLGGAGGGAVAKPVPGLAPWGLAMLAGGLAFVGSRRKKARQA